MVEGHGGRVHHEATAGKHPEETRSRVGMEGGRKFLLRTPKQTKIIFCNLVRRLKQREPGEQGLAA